MKKRALSIILILIMLSSVLIGTNIGVSAVSAPTSIDEVNARLAAVASGTYGIGKYFRNNQSAGCCFAGTTTACHKNHGGDYAVNDNYCNCKVATADIAGTTGGIQCFGYMRYVFYQLYGLPLATGMASSYYALSSNANVSIVGQITASSTASGTQSIFGSSKLGDVIQAKTASGGAHSMIVYGLSSTGVTVLEANYAAQCYIGTRTMTWSKFATTYPAFTVYRAANYPTNQTNIQETTQYNTILPFKSYIQSASTIYPYTSNSLSVTSGGEIWTSDECTITKIYENGACQVTYPAGSTTKTAYVALSEFVKTISSPITTHTFGKATTVYTTISGATQYFTIPFGATAYKLGQTNGYTEVFYSLNGSLVHGFVSNSDMTDSVYYGGYLLTIEDGSYYKITSYTGTETNITLPSSYDGYPITKIDANAFSGKNITSVTIPESVTYIGNQAFYNCSSLQKAYFLGNVPTTFGDDVFVGANSAFEIQYKVESMGWSTPTWTSSSGDVYSAYPAQIAQEDIADFVVSENSAGTRYLENITAGMTVSDIMSGVLSSSYTLVDADGGAVSSADRVGTGYRLQLKTEGGYIIDEIELVIYGDTTGDGYINAKDIVLMHRYYWHDGETDTASCQAARVGGYDTITTDDLISVSNMIVG